MKQAPEVFQEDLDEIAQVIWLVRKRNFDLIYDVMKLKHVDNIEKTEIVERISTKYNVDSATVYRNIAEVNELIRQRIAVLKLLRTTLVEDEFKDEIQKIRELMS